MTCTCGAIINVYTKVSRRSGHGESSRPIHGTAEGPAVVLAPGADVGESNRRRGRMGQSGTQTLALVHANAVAAQVDMKTGRWSCVFCSKQHQSKEYMFDGTSSAAELTSNTIYARTRVCSVVHVACRWSGCILSVECCVPHVRFIILGVAWL